MRVHPFEKAGLGEAPFRFVGMERRVGPIRIASEFGTTTEIGSPGQPMGVCDYCGTGIAYCCSIKSSDGKVFVVGTTCVNKTEDTRLISDSDRAVRKHRKELQLKRNGERIALGRKTLESAEVQTALAAGLHPKITGKSMLDYVEYLFKFGGQSGKVKACRIVERAAKVAQAA